MKSFESNTRENGEGIENEKKIVSNWLEKVNPALIPATLAAAVSAGEVQAESIESIHGQDWLQGVQTLHESVMSADTEVGANFIIGENGKEFWYSSGKGAANSVIKNVHDITLELAQFTEETGEVADRFCEAHTHNLGAMAAVNNISDDELTLYQVGGYGPSAPPSLADVNLFTAVKIQNAIGDIPYFSTVFDAQGVWYSRIPTDEDYDAFPNVRYEIDRKREIVPLLFGDHKNHFEGGLVTSVLESLEEQELEGLAIKYGSEQDLGSVEFIREKRPEMLREELTATVISVLQSNKDKNNPLITELLKTDADRELYQEYLDAQSFDENKFYSDTMQSWLDASKDGQIDESMLEQVYEAYVRKGAVVRFVPYDQIPNEPPCAGPDYR